MNTTALTLLRTAATVIITGLSAVAAYYPTQHWITAVILAAAVVGIHVIPAVGQTMVTINPPTNLHTMTTEAHQPFTGE